MAKLFLTLLNRSISASWVVLAVLLLRLALKKAPKAIRCVLWVLVAVRLVCPFSFESRLSLMPRTVSEEYLAAAASAEPGEIPGENAMVPSAANPSPETDAYLHFSAPSASISENASAPATSGSTTASWQTVCSILWAVGMAAIVLYAIFSYLRLYRSVKASVDLGQGVVLCDYIDTPFILGLVKPKIYLPSGLSSKDAAHVLAHERAHLKRKDHWWKPLGFALLSVYWFNPLLWLAYVLLCRDIELACDEHVVKNLEPADKKAYSEALLSCSVPRRMVSACPLAFGEVGVKERVKSVLHYKKPGFWIVLAAAAAVAAAAVCLLTDPAKDVLSDLLDIPKTGDISYELFRSSKGTAFLSSQEELDAVQEVLDSVRYTPSPVARKDDPDFAEEAGLGRYGLALNQDEECTWLWFSRDCSVVQLGNAWLWGTENAAPQSDYYTVENPGKLLALFSKYIDPVSRREVTAAPFATAEEPWEWMHNVTLEAIASAKAIQSEGNSSTSNILPVPRFEALLSILGGISEDELSGYTVISESGAGADHITTIHSHDPNLCINIADQANGLGVVIRYFEDPEAHLEIVMCPDLDNFLDYSTYIQQAYKWDIHNENLMQYMQDFLEHPAFVSNFLGYWLEWEESPITVSHGYASIQVARIQGWEYEAVEYQEGTKSFGVRCRPGGVEEGWLYISFWPEGYPEEADRNYEDSDSTAANPPYLYRKDEYPIGDYAVINDGADSWFQEYEEQIYVQAAASVFLYPEFTEADVPRYGSVTVHFPQSADGITTHITYLDWEEIGAELGTEEITLLDCAEYGDFLFMAEEHDGKSAVLVFQKEANGRVKLCAIQEPEKELFLGEDSCGYQTTYTTENTDLTFCLIHNEAVTGISCGSGYQDYIRITRWPILMILDNAKWPGTSGSSFVLRGDDPPVLAYRANTALRFRAPEDSPENCKYVYGADVCFGNGAEFSLGTEEINQLSELLIGLSPGSCTRTPSPVIGEKLVSLCLLTDDGLPGRNDEVRLTLDYDGENIVITVVRMQVRFYLPEAELELSFQVQDAQLSAYLKSMLDSGQGIGQSS